MKNHKPRTRIDNLRLSRSQAVRNLMDRRGLTVELVAEATDTKPNSVYKALEDHIRAPRIIAFLEKKLGREFRELWQEYPNHSAA